MKGIPGTRGPLSIKMFPHFVTCYSQQVMFRICQDTLWLSKPISSGSESAITIKVLPYLDTFEPRYGCIGINTQGTAGGPGGRDRTLAVKSRKTSEKSAFFRKKIKFTHKKYVNRIKYSRDCGWPRQPWPNAGRKKSKNPQKFVRKKIKIT